MSKKCVSVIIFIVSLSVIFIALIWGKINQITYVTDLSEYGNFEKFNLLGNLELFPETIPEGFIGGQYYFKYKEGFLDSECQVYLKCNYDKSTYKKEIERLAQIEETYQGKTQKIHYDTENFHQPAFVTVFENDGCYEYALLDEDNLSIVYIFIQWVKEKDIKFPNMYLPHDYKCVVSTEQSFSIYNFWDNEKGWYYVVPRVQNIND